MFVARRRGSVCSSISSLSRLCRRPRSGPGTPRRLLKFLIAAVVACPLATATVARAASYTSAASGDWTSDSTWSPATGYPSVYSGSGTGSGDTGIINGGYAVTFSSGDPNTSCFATTIGSTTSGTLAVSGGSLVIGGRLTLGNPAAPATGTFDLSGGTVDNVGVGTSSYGHYNSTNERAIRLGYGTSIWNGRRSFHRRLPPICGL